MIALFAGRRAAQPHFRCLVDMLHAYAMRRSMEDAGFRLASRCAKFVGGVGATTRRIAGGDPCDAHTL